MKAIKFFALLLFVAITSSCETEELPEPVNESVFQADTGDEYDEIDDDRKADDTSSDTTDPNG